MASLDDLPAEILWMIAENLYSFEDLAELGKVNPRMAQFYENTKSAMARILLPTWSPVKNYCIGDRVVFRGLVYKCAFYHRGHPAWQPDVSLGIWRRVRQ